MFILHLRSEISRLEKARLKVESAVAKLQLENLDAARRKSNGEHMGRMGRPCVRPCLVCRFTVSLFWCTFELTKPNNKNSNLNSHNNLKLQQQLERKQHCKTTTTRDNNSTKQHQRHKNNVITTTETTLLTLRNNHSKQHHETTSTLKDNNNNNNFNNSTKLQHDTNQQK